VADKRRPANSVRSCRSKSLYRRIRNRHARAQRSCCLPLHPHPNSSARMILLLSEVFPPMRGGSGRWLWELYRRMPRGSVHVATSLIPEAESFDRTHDLPVTRVPLRLPNWGVFNRRGGLGYLSALQALRRVVRQTRAD